MVREHTMTDKPGVQAHRQAGFTLVELMIVCVIAAIVMVWGIPSYREMVQNQQRDAALFDLIADLNLARSESLKRGTSVALCKSSSGTTCATGSTGYETGWIVFTDLQALGPPGTLDIDGSEPDETLLRNHPAPAGTLTIRGNNNVQNRVTFNPNLRVKTNGTLVVCDARGASYARAVVIDTVGRVRSGSDSDNNGIVEGQNGSNVTCP